MTRKAAMLSLAAALRTARGGPIDPDDFWVDAFFVADFWVASFWVSA